MDRESWVEFLEQRLGAADGPWPAPPTVPGPWRSLASADATHVLVDFTQEQLANEQRPVCETFPALRVRAMPLVCYARHLLCDVMLDTPEGPGIVSFIYGADGVRELNLSSSVFHVMNEALGSPVPDAASAGQYLRLFCGFTRASQERGRFQIVEALEQIPFDDALVEPDDRAAALRATLEPVVIEPAPAGDDARDDQAGEDADGADVAWTASATLLVARTLFNARFRIYRGGVIEMTDDEASQDELPVRIERYINTIRLP